MKPKKFQEANVVYGEGQPEYKPLPAHKTKEGQAIFCFELDEAERKKEVPANMCIVQPLILRRNGLNFTAEVEGHPVKLEDLARNDGLTPSEFAAWFIPVFDKAQETALTFAIIQFTTFRY